MWRKTLRTKRRKQWRGINWSVWNRNGYLGVRNDMIRDRLHSKKWLITSMTGLVLLEAGLFILHRNPYWRYEPGQPGILHHGVYAWNGIGHLVSAIGLLFLFGSVVYLLSLPFSKKWLYWTVVVAAVASWCGMLGIENTYAAHYGWDARIGITEFTISNARSRQLENPLWQAIVRWQVEPELEGWLRGSPLRHTHGWLSVNVVRIVPIAVATLDCDCSNCCVEEDSKASGR